MSAEATSADSARRFLQLTYTAGRSGFGVKQEVGDWTSEERRAVENRISATAGFGPWADHDAEAARRCVWDRATDGSRALWHTAAAGRDASGRPGNVFAHCILDRDPDRALPARPIGWWRSGDLLTPYGHAAVEEATLPSGDVPRPGDAVTHDSVVAHLGGQSAYSRLDLAQVLVDAVAKAMAERSSVVLGTSSVDAGAQWIGLVSHVMSPGSARGLTWSVLELVASAATVDSLEGAVRAGLHLICVPSVMIDAIQPRDDMVVLDEARPVRLGEYGGQHHLTHREQQIPVTAWSVLLECVLGLAVDGTPLRRLDETALAVGDRVVDHRWPLAALVAMDPDGYYEARSLGAEVISRFSPLGLRDAPARLVEACKSLVGSELGPEPADAAGVLVEAQHWSPATDLVWSLYWERVTARLDWFLGTDPPPVPSAGPAPVTPAEVAALADAVVAWDALPSDEDRVCLVLRVIDHLISVGATDDTSTETMRGLLQREIQPGTLLLADDYLPALVGSLQPTTLRRVVHPVLAKAPLLLESRLGTVLSEPSRQWLFPGGVDEVVSDMRAPTPLSVAAVLSARSSGLDSEDGQLSEWLVRAATTEVRGSPAVSHDQVPVLLATLFPDRVLPPDVLLAALERDPRVLGPDLLARSVVAVDPEDGRSSEIMDRIVRSRDRMLSRALLLQDLTRQSVSQVPSRRELAEVLRAGEELLDHWGPRFAQHLAEPVAGVLAVAVVDACMEESARRAPHVPELVLDALPHLGHGLPWAQGLLVDMAAHPVDGRFHPAAWYAVLATLPTVRDTPAALRSQPWQELPALRDGGQHLMPAVVTALGRETYDAELVEDVDDLIDRLVDLWVAPSDELDPGEVAERLVTAARQEVRRLTGAPGSLLGRVFRGRRR